MCGRRAGSLSVAGPWGLCVLFCLLGTGPSPFFSVTPDLRMWADRILLAVGLFWPPPVGVTPTLCLAAIRGQILGARLERSSASVTIYFLWHWALGCPHGPGDGQASTLWPEGPGSACLLGLQAPVGHSKITCFLLPQQGSSKLPPAQRWGSGLCPLSHQPSSA